MKNIGTLPESMTKVSTHYCPGCGHGIVHKLIGEVMDELNIREKTIGIAPVGCAVFAYNYFNCDMVEVAHGRPPAVATGLKRARPENIVFAYQGDGDLAAIGTAEIVHAANRGENITVIFMNNAIYGMTGGQMAPTTVIGQKTTTTPLGRDQKFHGYPVKVCELLSTLDGTAYAERISVNNPANVRKTRVAIKKAFLNQINGKGFSLVEILSPCPVNWGLPPNDALKWLEKNMMPVFPLGIYADREVKR